MRQFILRSSCILFFVVASLNTVKTSHGQQLSDQLPTDLFFVTGKGSPSSTGTWQDIPSNTIGRIDAKTLKVSEFYTDSTTQWLIPISWSPQGDKLAIFRGNGDLSQLCVVSILGKLQSCFEGGIPNPSMEDPLLKVSWSEDGKSIYFVVERNGYRELVAGNPDAGEITQSIYKYARQRPAGFNNITWSSSARYIVQDMSNYPEPATLVDLKTGSHLALDSIVPTGQGGICSDFSPKDTYLVLIHYEQSVEEMIVLDRGGTVVRRISSDYDKTHPIRLARWGCPAWSSDETFFYFYAEDRNGFEGHLYKYLFGNDQVTQVMPDAISPPLVLSPQGTHLAFLSPDSDLISILYPDGHVKQVGAAFRYAQYPVWVPQSQ